MHPTTSEERATRASTRTSTRASTRASQTHCLGDIKPQARSTDAPSSHPLPGKASLNVTLGLTLRPWLHPLVHGAGGGYRLTEAAKIGAMRDGLCMWPARGGCPPVRYMPEVPFSRLFKI